MNDTNTVISPLAKPDMRRKGEVPKGLSALDWWTKVGTAEARRVAIEAGTTYEHFKHIAHGRRKCSVSMASRLYQASNGGMSFAALIGVDRDILAPTKRRSKS